MTDDHGTRRGYETLGCRCDACRAFNAEKARLRRAKHPTVKPMPQHGQSMYKNRGCRCDICKAGNAVYQRAWRAAKRDDW